MKDIANDHDLHSAMIQEVGGDVVAGYKANENPATPASTMKLIIAEVLLQNNEPLSNTINISSSG